MTTNYMAIFSIFNFSIFYFMDDLISMSMTYPLISFMLGVLMFVMIPALLSACKCLSAQFFGSLELYLSP